MRHRFRDMFERLGVIWTGRVEELVRSTSDASNPAEASRPDSVRRNSAAHVTNWKRRLTADEIARVRGHRASLDGVLRRQRLVSAGE